MSAFGKGVRRCVGFTGQGSQWVGMGRDVLGKVEEAGKRLREVEGVLGIDIGHIMLSSDEVDVIGCINIENSSEYALFSDCHLHAFRYAFGLYPCICSYLLIR